MTSLGQAKEPDLSGKPEWEPLTVPELLTNPGSYVSGDPEGIRLRLKYYHDPITGRIVARTWFGPGTEGPPGHAHGGSIAAVMDEAMGMAALFAGFAAVAGSVSFNFQQFLPLNTVASAITWVEGVEGKKIMTEGQLIGPDDAVYASASGIFINIGFKALSNMLA